MTQTFEPRSRSFFRRLSFRSARPAGGPYPSDASCARGRLAPHPDRWNLRLASRRSLAAVPVALAVAMISVAHAQDNAEADTTPPSLVGQQVMYGWPELRFNEELISYPGPDNSAFAIMVDGVSRSVSSVRINNSSSIDGPKSIVMLIPFLRVQSGETAVISYTPPATHPIRTLQEMPPRPSPQQSPRRLLRALRRPRFASRRRPEPRT